MAVLRKLAPHGVEDTDETRARAFVALIDAVLFALRGPHQNPKPEGVAGTTGDRN